jgi:translation initiation factor 3 subunit E
MQNLSEKYPNITSAVIDAYRDYGRFQFDCGDYESARTILSNYILLYAYPPITAQQPQSTSTASDTNNNATSTSGTNEDNEDEELAGITATQQLRKDGNTTSTTSATTTTPAIVGNPAMFYLQSCDSAMLHVLWGRLACEILVLDWTNAMKAMEAVKTAFESMVTTNQLTALQALQQRTWLLHWSLFVYWNAPAGLEQLVELFLSERYKQAITTVAPHLLRYLTAAVLLCKRRGEKAVPTAEARKLVKMLIYVMQDCDYTDPIVEFVNCLCIKFDFDSAQEKLAACEKVLSADFFLCHQTALFMEEARVFVFENYCRIHNKIDLVALGDKLAMDQDRAERWIVDLIRNAELDAKIDSAAGCVVMGLSQPPTIHEMIVDRTRDCNIRTATMTQNLTNMLLEARKEKLKREQLAREQD